MRIRPASEDDAEQIALVNVRSWQGAYRGLLPQEYLDRLDPAQRAERWRSTMREPSDRAGILVAAGDPWISGFVSFGPSRDSGADRERTGEVNAIYVLPQAWGTGVGRRLMSAAVERLSDAGFTEAILWVLDTNARARGFYAAAGWADDGAVKTDQRLGFPITEVRYRRGLP